MKSLIIKQKKPLNIILYNHKLYIQNSYKSYSISSTSSSNLNNNKILNDQIDLKRKFNNLYRFHEGIKGKEEEIVEEQVSTESNTKISFPTKVLTGFKSLWQKTFPKEKDYDRINLENMEIAKLLKSKIKWAKDEEIKKLQSTVLEWKQNAVNLLEEVVFDKKESKIKAYMQSISNQIKDSESYSQMKQTSTYKEYLQFKDDLSAIQSNIKETISMSYNPATVLLKDLVDKVTVKTTTAEGVTIMRKIDPDFDFYELTDKVSVYLKNVLKAEFNDDLSLIEVMCVENALAVEGMKIKLRKEKGLEFKIKEPIYVDVASYHDTIVVDEDHVRFRFIINVQENNCLVDKEGKVVEGKISLVENCHYVVEVLYDQEAHVELLGHNWIFSKIERTGVVEQII